MSGSLSILVVSDSHGHLPPLRAVLRWAAAAVPPIDAAVFLGDGAEDPAAASADTGFAAPWYKVRGNGDLDFSVPGTMVLEVPGGTAPPRRFFLAHGNRHGVDRGFQDIAAAAGTAGAEAALFGHTHVPFCGIHRGIFLLNPGSIARPRSSAGPSFALLNCPARGPLSASFRGLISRNRVLTVTDLEL